MKNMKRLLTGYAALIMLTAMPGIVQAKDTPPADRISIQKARSVALQAYPGKIQGEELEFEGGKWIYSFDLKKPNDGQVHEVHVDAIKGTVLDIHAESASDERKELQEDAAHPEHK